MCNKTFLFLTAPLERGGVLSDRELAALTASRVHYYSNTQGKSSCTLPSTAVLTHPLSRRVLY